MYRLTSKLIIYSNLGDDCILYRLSDICRRFQEKSSTKEELVRDTLLEIHRLLDVSTTYGFNKNLWHNYLAFLLAMTETPFTLVSEKVGANKGSVNQFAKNDLAVFKELFDYDFSPMEKELGLNCFSIIQNFTAVEKKEQTIEESFARLDEMVKKMDSEDIPLEESFRLYEEGMKLLRNVNGRIDQVEKKMKQITGDGGEEVFE